MGVPLIGFAGAPFTVASYLVEGGPSRSYARTKALMHGDPTLWASLLDTLADIAVASLRAQVAAGAGAVQLFDSWAGALAPGDYERFVLPASRKVLRGLDDLGVPRIHFGVGTGELLALMAGAGAEVVGVDWRVPLDEARRRVGPGRAVQGNLDPAVCLAPWDVVESETRDVLVRGGGTGHVFNLGHGVLPETDPAVLGRIVEPALTRSAATVSGGRLEGSAVTSVGVLVMSHGTPRSLDELPAFYTEIRRGRPPPPELLADLARRYEAIGGTSPLNERTRAQVEGIRGALEARAPGAVPRRRRRQVRTAADRRRRRRPRPPGRAQHDRPRPHTPLLRRQRRCVRGGGPADAAASAGGGRDAVVLRMIDQWHLAPAFVRLVAGRVPRRVARLPDEAGAGAMVVFTAHSIPARLVDAGDPYAAQVHESAAAVAQAADVDRWCVAWQSAGRTDDAWLGPDVREVIAGLADTAATGVVVCPIGFVSDHLEVLYDLDVEAADAARRVGLPFARTASLNDDPAFCAMLADVVVAAVDAARIQP